MSRGEVVGGEWLSQEGQALWRLDSRLRQRQRVRDARRDAAGVWMTCSGCDSGVATFAGGPGQAGRPKHSVRCALILRQSKDPPMKLF